MVVSSGRKMVVWVDLGLGALVGVRWIGQKQWAAPEVSASAPRLLLRFGRVWVVVVVWDLEEGVPREGVAAGAVSLVEIQHKTSV